MTPLSDVELAEYQALRATIRERGTARVVVAGITFVAWAVLALAVGVLTPVPAFALMPLLVLAAGFEIVFAIHTGVERIGRYLQVRYEAGSDRPLWESIAMQLGRERTAAIGVDALFTALFAGAAILNLLPLALASAVGAPTVAGVPLEAAVYGMFHLLFLGRLVRAKLVTSGQRGRDQELLGRLLSPRTPGARNPSI